jgi:uncharacterized YigZ family protein
MSVYSYLTLKESTEGLYKERGSKFLAFAYPVSTEADIKQQLDQVKKQYFDARHHCYAWMLGAEKNRFRAFDDGEPNHSAGDPILGQIRSKGVTNVLIVVVRYFGGVKLGVGGLITAYRTAAEEALNNALIIEEEVSERLELSFEYILISEVMRLVKDFHITILEENFSDDCRLKISIPLLQKEKLFKKTTLMNAVGKTINYVVVPE